ncbi:MAG: AbrB/MazE/SpoVT family DNA-binding domain-containing protein [SAR202 cluster bacterium]|nr:AbrB family transcriptional regulator [Gemmatimonadota bacterium]MQG34694.1 AbrB/MazE/SpoVT family DNA-binding domain-containing protein [SAR202 cluster bacterium]HCP24030.1 AbrB family transcriptional regulator [Dehalococcoidia bacterium]
MPNLVGTKGQVVINKEIRDQLGIGPGWMALQRFAGDHVEIYFVAPEHEDSLAGSLAPHIRAPLYQGAEWAQAREATGSLRGIGQAGPMDRGL